MSHSITMGSDAIGRAAGHKQPAGSMKFDWTMIALSIWLLGGAFVDGWAHTHGQIDTSFFTPWHAVLYSGFLAVAGYLMVSMLRNLARGYAWRWALPAGYGLALVGALIFWLSGVGDLIWHEIFGIEEDVEALLSPTHLLLACGAWLIIGGPFRAAWRRDETHIRSQMQLFPMLLSLTCMLSMCTFITQIAHPMANLWGRGSPPDPAWLFQEMGVVSILLDTALLMGFVLVAMRRWTLPLGAFTLIVTLNAIAMGCLLYNSSFPLIHVATRAAAGLAVDLLYAKLKPSTQQPGRLHLFAFTMPAIMTGTYFLSVQVTEGLWWSVHMWTGMIALAGVVGLLLSYLMLPPPIPVKPHDVT